MLKNQRRVLINFEECVDEQIDNKEQTRKQEYLNPEEKGKKKEWTHAHLRGQTEDSVHKMTMK